MARRDGETVREVPVSLSLNLQARVRCPRPVLQSTTCEGA